MGGWLGVVLALLLPEERQRNVLWAAGALLDWRGTMRGLEGLLAAFIAAPVQVQDHGGVFARVPRRVFARGAVPPADRRVTVRLESAAAGAPAAGRGAQGACSWPMIAAGRPSAGCHTYQFLNLAGKESSA